MAANSSFFLADNCAPHNQSFIQFCIHAASKKKGWIALMCLANLFLLFSFHLLYARFCSGFPYVVPSTARSTNQNFHTNLEQLVNSPENKQIFSQLKFSDQAFYDPHDNVVGTTEFPVFNQYQRQPYVANGYIGSRIPNLGQGFTYDQLTNSLTANDDDLLNGWPLFNKRYSGAFVAGFYDLQKNTTGTNFAELLENGYESVIAAVPQWTALSLSVEILGKKYTLDPSLEHEAIGDITNYVQNMSLSDGIVTTQFTWLNTFDVKYEILAHRENINLGLVNMQVYNPGNESVQVIVSDVLDFNSSQRCQLNQISHDKNGIYVTFHPQGLSYIDGAIYSTLSANGQITREQTNETVFQNVELTIEPHSCVQVTKYVGIATTDLDPDSFKTADDVLKFARKVSQNKKHGDATQLVNSHRMAWSKIIQDAPLVTFPSDSLLNLGARASIFHLLANTRPNAEGVTGALGVSGLSSDSYGGMVFWDTDLWMLNGILPFAPDHIKSFINYRVHLHQQAIDNVPRGYQGAVYPWTSGRFGNCTGTGPCLDYEYHINMAVAMASWQLHISGAADDTFLESVAYPIINDAASFLAEYVVHYNDTLGKYTTKNLTDPDEFANHVDNGAYTNTGIVLVMRWAQIAGSILGKQVPKIYHDIETAMFLPTAENTQNITLEYSGMNSSVGIKQADVIMMTYPLENELIDQDQAYINMEFYSMKQVGYGPAMTFPIFSIVASNLAFTGCASQSYLHKAIQPFLRGPFAQFAEQNNDDYLTNGGTHPAFPFLTAHGGFLQAILQGLTGMRFDYTFENNKLQRLLKLDPIALPCLGEGVRFDSIKYDNHTLSMAINETHFTIKNKGKTTPNARNYVTILLAERNAMHGKYTINDEDEQSFPLFETSESFPDSISECNKAGFFNITEGAYGDVSILINDGDNTTSWQAKYNDTTGKVLVDLKSFRNISSGTFIWGDKPPKRVKVSKYSGSSFTAVTDFFAQVDFGNELFNEYKYANPEGKLHNQSDVFEEVYSGDVKISAPFDPEEYFQVWVPTRHNITEVAVNLQTRFLLIEVDEIHNTEAIDGDYGGAKLAEVVFY